MSGEGGMLSLADLRVVAEGLDHPEGVAPGLAGELYAGGEAGQVYRIDPGAGTQEQVADTGGFVLGVAIDGAGAVYACDAGRAAVLRIDAGSGVVETYWRERGRTASDRAELGCLRRRGVALVLGLGPRGSRRARRPARPHPSGRGRRRGARPPAPLHFPNGLCVSPDGTVYLLESLTPRLSALRESGAELVADLPGVVPDGVALDDGGFLVACYYPFRILRVSFGGDVQTMLDDPIGIDLIMPTNLAFFGPELRTLAIAQLGGWSIKAIDVPWRGAPLHYPAKTRPRQLVRPPGRTRPAHPDRGRRRDPAAEAGASSRSVEHELVASELLAQPRLAELGRAGTRRTACAASTIARCAAAATEIPVFQACGTTRPPAAAASSHTRRASVSPPTRPMSGWTTCDPPRRDRGPRTRAASRATRPVRCERASAAAELGVARRGRRPRAASRGRRRRAPRAPRPPAGHARRESKAYCTSTMSRHLRPDRLPHRRHDLDHPLVGAVRAPCGRTGPRRSLRTSPHGSRAPWPACPSRPSTRRTRRTTRPPAGATRRASASSRARLAPRAASTDLPGRLARRCPRARCRARRSRCTPPPRLPVIAVPT